MFYKYRCYLVVSANCIVYMLRKIKYCRVHVALRQLVYLCHLSTQVHKTSLPDSVNVSMTDLKKELFPLLSEPDDVQKQQ